MSKEISTAYRLWLATLERGQTIDVEQAFAAGHKAAAAGREWNLDMSAAPHNGTIVEVAARYPQATAGYPRYAGFRPEEDAWFEFSRHAPGRVIPWAWRHRTEWPDEPERSNP